MDEGSKPPEQTPSLPPVAHKLVPTAEKSNFPPPPVTMSHRENFTTHVPSPSKSDPKGDNVLQISPTVHTTPKPNALPEMAITPTVAHQASDNSTRSGGQESSTPESSSGSDFHPKLPILRLKKTGGGEDDESATFEKQDTSKNDSYCWVCHDGGDVLCCDKCARVFHVQCSGLNKAPEGEEDWFCPVCKNIGRKTKRSRPSNLKELLLLAVKRMMFPGTEIFQAAVPDDIMTHYREYIFFPMHLGRIKEKVMARQYGSTREFLHDTEWILHNCIIYNGAKHALTKIAKGIVKVCKEDMREIELCPSCYSLTVTQPDDWFCIPCNPPHRVVLAKVRGYPLWPAKLISETSDKCDVRFFGQHDRSLVSKSSIQELNGPPPTPTSKTQFWNIAMYELKRYRENINVMLEQMGGKVVNTNSTPKPPRELKLAKPTKEITQPSPSQVPNHVDYSQQDGTRYSQEPVVTLQTLPVSNYVPFSPQLVEVSVNLSETEDGSMHGNSATLMQSSESVAVSEPSSPGSEPELQIDLGEPGGTEQQWRAQRERHSPGKVRVTPPAKSSMLGGLSRNTMVLNMNSSRQSVASPVVSSTQGSGSSPVLWTPNFKRGLRGRKPGEALSALATSLAERKRVAELGSQTPVLTTPTSALGEGGYGNGSYQESMEVEEDSDEVKATQLNSQFSSVYLDRAKTAIAVVDLDTKGKGLRKRKKIAVEQTPKKVPRIQNTSKVVTPVPNISGLEMHGEAMAASLTSQVNAAVNFGRQESPSNGISETLKVKVTQNGQSSPASVSPGGGGGTSKKVGGVSGKGGGGTTKASGKGKGGKFVLGSHAGKKAKSRAKNASLAKSSSVWPAKTTSAATPTSTLSSHSTSPQTNTVLTSVANQDVSLMATTVTPVEGIAVERGGLVEEETPEFAEGSGLLAETVQKVDRSFRARINQMAGSSEDMGYQYFSEKLMTSIKTVLIEMLSMFEAKGRMGAKQLKEQLHSAWPIPDSTVALAHLRKELVEEMKQSLEVVRASSELERQQVVNEVRRQAEAEKEVAIAETKKKKWCSYCWKEAQYNCCWNANYCNEVCQQAHWPEHMKSCTQVSQQQQQPQQQVPPRTPVAVETPVMKVPHAQIPMLATVGEQQQQFVYTNPVPVGSGHVTVNQNANSSVNPTSATMHHPSMYHHQHRTSSSHEHMSPMMSIATNGLQHAVDPQPLEQPIEHIPNENVIMNPNAVSPPHHIRDLILNQQANKSPVITGANSILANTVPGLRTSDSSNLTLTSSLNSDHSSNSSTLGMQPPMSPVSPSENPPSIHNPGFSWAYQQPVIIGGENFTQTLPLLPAVQASTPTTQNHAFFKAF